MHHKLDDFLGFDFHVELFDGIAIILIVANERKGSKFAFS